MTFQQVLLTLKKRYWIVLAGALIAGAVALVLSLVWPRSYEANALLLISKLRSEITLDPRFQTVAEENVVNTTVQEDQVRRQTLVTLAGSSALVRQASERLAEELPPEERSAAALKGATDIHTEGNLIVFSTRADSPRKAAVVANAWAQAFKEHVNRLYSATSPSDAQIQAQLAQAQETYQAAQSAVEAFLLQDPAGELARQIDQKSQILADLQAAQLNAAKQRASFLLSHMHKIDQLLLQAQTMVQQLGSAAANTALTAGEQFSLFTLESAAFSSPGDEPVTLEIGQNWPLDEGLTAGQAIKHLDRLQETLQGSRATTKAQLEALSLDLLEGKDLLTQDADEASAARIADLQAEINALQSELERQTMMKEDLVAARDVAQENHLTLLRKTAEIQILSQLTGVEVEMAAEAQPPEAPVFPRPALNTALGVIAGALAGLALAFMPWGAWISGPEVEEREV